MSLFIFIAGCGSWGLQGFETVEPLLEDTGVVSPTTEADPVADETDGASCGWLEVSWTPNEAAVRTELLGELVDDSGEQVLVWGLHDTAEGAATVSGGWEVCGLAFRGVGASDVDGDGEHDAWSSEVSGDGCVEVGEITCALAGVGFAPTLERREDGCSTWCVPPA